MKLALAASMAIALTGCAYQATPLKVMPPVAMQQPAAPDPHWDGLAEKVARHVQAGLAVAPDQPVTVRAENSSPFSRALLSMLKTHLLALGVPVSEGPALMEVRLETQVLPYHGKTAAYPRNGSGEGVKDGTEVLVNTSLTQGGRYLSRTSDLYYIEGADAALYLPAAPVYGKTIQVVGP
ncbi:hypothetical protein Ga0061063_0846 [Gulbenkiania indica]|uniref:FlgO domain-containing protein n=2 Tax=Gulbenkiania indica TaxID=375574 RepID=A0A0K6GTW0_9NEIS|nr:hypothetical protein Ga0061063_0846 [Gulbenkiania indica]